VQRSWPECSGHSGATGLGTAVKYIRVLVVGRFYKWHPPSSSPSTQIKDFFRPKSTKVPGEFLARIEILARNFRSFHRLETGLGILALVLILVSCVS